MRLLGQTGGTVDGIAPPPCRATRTRNQVGRARWHCSAAGDTVASVRVGCLAPLGTDTSRRGLAAQWGALAKCWPIL